MATLAIPRFRVTGTVTRQVTDPQPVSNAEIVVDRTVAGGLNSLPQGDTLTVTIGYSVDGLTWFDACSAVFQTGSFVIPKTGGTIDQEILALGLGAFGDAGAPAGTQYRATLTASVPVFIAATITTSKTVPQPPI